MLGLKVSTDAAWVDAAMRDLDRVLVDHAHCEMKAASNALSLAARHPDSPALVRALTDLAREEIDHFQRVLAVLEARGLTLGPPPVDECERFKLLAAALLEAGEATIGAFYTELLAAEARHHRSFVDLAVSVAPDGTTRDDVLGRLEELATREAEIVRNLAHSARARATIHG
jgi:tRNA-(ms[2]io[6]A)-hydroxylase